MALLLKDEFLRRLAGDPQEDCSICCETLRVPTTTACKHTFCLECLRTWLKKANTCPYCRNKLYANSIAEVRRDEQRRRDAGYAEAQRLEQERRDAEARRILEARRVAEARRNAAIARDTAVRRYEEARNYGEARRNEEARRTEDAESDTEHAEMEPVQCAAQ